MLDTQGYIQLRKGLKEHLAEGKMNGTDLMVFVALLLFADYQTGICWKISAPFLANFLHEGTRRVNRALRRLDDAGYIVRHGCQRGVSWYSIIIHLFRTSLGHFIDAPNCRLPNEIALFAEGGRPTTVLPVSYCCPTAVPVLSLIKEYKKKERRKKEDTREEISDTPNPPEPEPISNPITEIPTEGQARTSSTPEDREIHYLWKVYHDESVCRNSSVPWKIFYQNAAGAMANGYTCDDLELKLVKWREQGGSATAPSWEIWKEQLAGAKETGPQKEYEYDKAGNLVELGGE